MVIAAQGLGASCHSHIGRSHIRGMGEQRPSRFSGGPLFFSTSEHYYFLGLPPPLPPPLGDSCSEIETVAVALSVSSLIS